MACIQYPRKERGGVNLGSWEKPTIYRDPPKEIMTRKKERIEEGDVTYNIRNQPDRYNDAITNWQKGKNMMVQVDYQNRTQQMTTMNFGAASNPYKVNQAFRPPAFRQVDLQPLSRQQRPYTAAQTNIGSLMTRDDHTTTRIDQSEIAFSTSVQPIHTEANTKAAREMGVYADNFERKDMINEEYVTKQVLSKLKGIESVELQKFFSYENTPNGIVLTPLSISTSSVMNGPIQVDSQRHIGESSYVTEVSQHETGVNRNAHYTKGQDHINDEQSYIQDHIQVGLGMNPTGSHQIDGQRHVTDIQAYLQDQLAASLGANKKGIQRVDEQRTISDEQAYLQEQLIIALYSVLNGVSSVDGQRHISDEQAYLHEQLLIAAGVNPNGLGYIETQSTNDEQTYIQEQLRIALGTNIQGNQSIQGQRTLTDEQYYVHEQLLVALGSNYKSTPIQGQFYIDEDAFLQPVQYIGTGSNTSASVAISTQPESTTFYIKEDGTLATGHTNPNGVSSIEGQRHIAMTALPEVVQIGIGSNQQGVQRVQSGISDEQRYLQEQLRIGLGSNTSGVQHMGSRFMNEKTYLTYLAQLGLGANRSGTQRNGQRQLDEQAYIQEKKQIGLGANTHSIQLNGEVDHQEKVKEILLKNMSSSVHIVIQTGAMTDEYQMNGSIQDKIGIVVNSAKGTPLELYRENGEPIRLKEYTWKFIKSASGSDKFVIHVPQELELERKSQLYSVSSNPNQSTSLSVNDDVQLKREMRPMSAATNLILSGDLQRVDETVLTNRVEKHTKYTDMMVASLKPTMDRADGATDAIRAHQSTKKQNISQTILKQSQGRFD